MLLGEGLWEEVAFGGWGGAGGLEDAHSPPGGSAAGTRTQMYKGAWPVCSSTRQAAWERMGEVRDLVSRAT